MLILANNWSSQSLKMSSIHGADLSLYPSLTHLRRNELSLTRSPAVQQPDHAGAAYWSLDSTVARKTSLDELLGHGREVTAQLVSTFVLPRLDHCNYDLAGLPRPTTEPLLRVHNAAARLVVRLGPFNHLSAALKQLNWLPFEHRIRYKPCLLKHSMHIKKFHSIGRAASLLLRYPVQGVVSDPLIRPPMSNLVGLPERTW